MWDYNGCSVADFWVTNVHFWLRIPSKEETIDVIYGSVLYIVYSVLNRHMGWSRLPNKRKFRRDANPCKN